MAIIETSSTVTMLTGTGNTGQPVSRRTEDNIQLVDSVRTNLFAIHSQDIILLNFEARDRQLVIQATAQLSLTSSVVPPIRTIYSSTETTIKFVDPDLVIVVSTISDIYVTKEIIFPLNLESLCSMTILRAQSAQDTVYCTVISSMFFDCPREPSPFVSFFCSGETLTLKSPDIGDTNTISPYRSDIRDQFNRVNYPNVYYFPVESNLIVTFNFDDPRPVRTFLDKYAGLEMIYTDHYGTANSVIILNPDAEFTETLSRYTVQFNLVRLHA